MIKRLPIFTYHSLDESGSVISTAPEQFARTMQQMAIAGWSGMSVSSLIEQTDEQFPTAKRFGLCFDDGYRSVVDLALPILDELGFSATVFVITGRCGGDNRWPDQPLTIPSAPLLAWNDVDELASAGWEIASHTVTHPNLMDLELGSIVGELERSKETLERHLSSTVSLFAYPYGAYDNDVQRLVSRYYEFAVNTRLACATWPDIDRRLAIPRIDSYYLNRIPIAPHIDRWLSRTYLGTRRWGRSTRDGIRRLGRGNRSH